MAILVEIRVDFGNCVLFNPVYEIWLNSMGEIMLFILSSLFE